MNFQDVVLKEKRKNFTENNEKMIKINFLSCKYKKTSVYYNCTFTWLNSLRILLSKSEC